MTDRVGSSGVAPPLAEWRKLSAFARRDFLVAWSYRAAFVSDIGGLVLQTVLFALVGRLIRDDALPAYGADRSSYLAFVAVGLVVGGLLQLGMTKLVSVIRHEQLIGTMEPLLATPTHTTTIQLGVVIYDLIYIPIRTALFLIIVQEVFAVTFAWEQLGPALLILLGLTLFAWGIGLIGAAGVMTFRRGARSVGTAAGLLGFGSGVYVPLTVFPAWFQQLAEHNPIAVGLEGLRQALLGGAGWDRTLDVVVMLIPTAVLSISVGSVLFNLAGRRERQRGTLGHY